MALESSALPEDTDDESPVAPRTIVQPRSPSTLATFHSKPPMLHAFRPDLDPTEWKPDSAFSIASSTAQTGPEGNPEAEPAETRPHHYRAYSAAFTYLSQFHGSATSFLGKGRRPKLISRASTPAVPLARTAPSTITLPAMSAGNSTSSDGSGFLRTPENGICGRATLHPSGRPSTCAGLKGVDLVKPTFSATVAVKEGELVYGKKLVAPPATGPSEDMVLVGSLSRFLGGGDADAATVQSG
ncbi:MAG: hypothetical protein LQ340_001938 [Diploschistes diacapsis]|nr:MAG: hypothetical protein LQ340_001938 [Diploschistes diacapsis]